MNKTLPAKYLFLIFVVSVVVAYFLQDSDNSELIIFGQALSLIGIISLCLSLVVLFQEHKAKKKA